MKKNHDVIILGMATPGLIAGALLAKHGLKVLVVNQKQIPQNFQFGKFPIPRDQTLDQGFKRYLFESIFEQIGLTDAERTLFQRAETSFQVILPRHRLTLSSEREDYLAEYGREFPNEYPAIQTFIAGLIDLHEKLAPKVSHDLMQKNENSFRATLTAANKRESKPLTKTMTELGLSRDFQLTILAQVKFLTQFQSISPSLAVGAQAIGSFLKADPFFSAHPEALARIFKNRIVAAGGEIRDQAHAEKIWIDRRSISGIQMSSADGIIQGKLYIGNADPHHLMQMATIKRKSWFSKPIPSPAPPTFSKCALYIGLPREHLPVGMGGKLILVRNESMPLLGDNFILLEVHPGPPEDPSIILLQATFMIPYLHWQEADLTTRQVDLPETTREVMNHVAWLIPFMREKVVMVLPNFVENLEGDAPAARSLQSLPLLDAIYTWDREPHPEDAPDRPKQPARDKPARDKIGFTIQSPVENLILTGPDVFPFMGFEGDALSGIFAAGIGVEKIIINPARTPLQKIMRQTPKHLQEQSQSMPRL